MADGEAGGAKELFLEALELDPAERESFLERACRGEPTLLGRVRRLLRAQAEVERATGGGGGLPLVPAGLPRALAAGLGEPRPGASVGPYRVLETLGEGGFGTVYLAEQERPLRRRVALKVLKPGLATPEVTARFDAERQALARMEHPSIARIFDGGTTESGRPYFALELVDGAPITDFCAARGLGVRARLELFLEVCRAVQHAHQKGVIHRDIKPSNVLVTTVDGRAVPKVIDFGIAKAVEGGVLTDATLFTQGGQLVGTPTYMAPEQIDASPDVDTRADVYSLGVLLYELLSGTTPFDLDSPRPAALLDFRRRVCEDEPERPSTRLRRTTGSGGEDRAPRVDPRQVRGDLDWIVLRCLEKDRDRRYDSAAVLANEIGRHLAGEPVMAGPAGFSYRAAKFVRRHRAALAVAALLGLVLVGATVVSTAQAVRARRAERSRADEADHARTELARSRALAGFLEHLLLSIDPAVAGDKDQELLRDVLRRAKLDVEKRRGSEELPPLVEASVRRILGGAYLSIAEFEEAEAQLRAALELRAARLDAEDPATLESRNDLAGLLLRMRRYAEAEAPLVAVAEARRRRHGDEDPRTLETLVNLGALYKELRRYEEAEELLLHVEEVRVRTLGAEHEDTVLVSNNLAGVLDALGRHEEAQERYERALAFQLAANGPRHPRTLVALNNLAGLFIDVGRDEDAARLLEQALEAKREILPPRHPSLVVTLTNLARTYGRLGRAEEAEALHVEALEASLESLGARNVQTLIARQNYAAQLERTGRFEEAEAQYREVVAAAGEVAGEDSPLFLAAEDGLAGTLLELGRPDEAAPFARHCAETAPRAYPAGRPAIGVLRARYGLVLRAQGKREEAVAELEAALALLEAAGEETWRGRAAEALAELGGERGEGGPTGAAEGATGGSSP